MRSTERFFFIYSGSLFLKSINEILEISGKRSTMTTGCITYWNQFFIENGTMNKYGKHEIILTN